MTFDDLGEVWRREGVASSDAADLDATRARVARLERAVRRRDRLETIVAIALVPIFAWTAATAASALSAFGAGIVAIACVFIPIRLRMARRRAPDRGLPVARAVEAELAGVRAQARLLGSVAWWYLTPLGAGVILFMAGAPVSLVTKVGYGVAVCALYGWLLYLNQQAVRRDLQPVAAQLEDWLASFHASSNGISDAS